MQKFREWLIGSYNGLYKIILEPSMPSRQTVLILVIAFIVGLVWAYSLGRIVYYDGDPSQLEQSWQNEWVQLLADRYERITSTSATGPEFDQSIITLLAAVDNPLGIAQALGISNPNFLQLAQQAEPGNAPPPRPSIIASITPFIVGSLVVIIVTPIIALLGRILIYPNLIEPVIKRMRGGTAASDEATQRTIDAMRAARDAEAKAKESAAPVDAELGEPVTRKMSVFLMGRGQYDDSFEIEDANEMFLGECGAAIAETIGEGTPTKVAAIEIWLFDKDDFVRTLTGVFATEYAFNDPAIRSKLEPKGSVVLLRDGAVLTLDTNTLRLQARIIKMGYGDASNSYIENATIEIAVWRKVGAARAVPAGGPPPLLPEKPLPLDIQFDPPPVIPATPARPMAAPATPPAMPPVYSPPTMPAAPPSRPLAPQDDDPFGGTGDFTPIS